MDLLFLCSGGSSCRSLMAKTILESLDNQLAVYAATIHPLTELSPLASGAMEEIGLFMNLNDIHKPTDFQKKNIDYLITVCDGTRKEIKNLPIQFKHKLYLGFADPELATDSDITKQNAYRYLRDEIKTEMHYFYHRILKKQTTN